MGTSSVNIGQPPKVSEQRPVVPQLRELSMEIWRIFARIIDWVKGNYCTEKDVEAIVEKILKKQVLFIRQQKEPSYVPEGFVAIYADIDDGNNPKLKYNTGSGEGVVIRIDWQENVAGES